MGVPNTLSSPVWERLNLTPEMGAPEKFSSIFDGNARRNGHAKVHIERTSIAYKVTAF